jgi:hypothetical protein
VKGEHRKGWVEQLPNEELEELLLNAALVYAQLLIKLDSQWLKEVDTLFDK